MESQSRRRDWHGKPLVILALGDSKSAPDSQTWAHHLANLLTTADNRSWRAIELGRGGYTVAKVLDNLTANHDGGTFTSSIIDDALANCETTTTYLDRCQMSLRGLAPTHILLNAGVNDPGFVPPWVLPNQTAWQNNYLAIIDTLHAQWPDATIWISKVWKRQSGGDETLFDTMATWIGNVVAARSAYTFALDDERAWLKDSAYSDDNIHYNVAGQIEKASRALTALGY